MYSHSFKDIELPPRYGLNPLPWTKVIIEVAPQWTGTYTYLDDQPVAPDANPGDPTPVDLTVDSDTEHGWFRVRFSDNADVLSEYGVPIESPSDIVQPSDYRPSVAQLGVIMRARTQDSNGVEVGTFNADTRPTDIQVEEIFDQASAVVAGRVGRVPSRLQGLAMSLVALRAAMYVETSFYPEETNPAETSAYERYRQQYNDVLEHWESSIDVGPVSGGTGNAIASIPVVTDLNPNGWPYYCPDELCN